MEKSNTDHPFSRIRNLGGSTPTWRAESVLYVMSRDQRVADNHALLAAQAHALKEQLPLVVGFVLLKSSGHRAREHYEFMLDGLTEVSDRLHELNISFELRIVESEPLDTLQGLVETHKPAAVYFDFSPLKGPLSLHKALASANLVPVYEVDTHNIIPAWEISQKQEFGAYTMRPKVHKLITTWLGEPGEVTIHTFGHAKSTLPTSEDIETLLGRLRSNGASLSFIPGEAAANEALDEFVRMRLERYAIERNDATKEAQSELSPYLHYGQLSSLRVALRLIDVLQKHQLEPFLFVSSKLPQPDGKPALLAGVDALLEELIVRKELSDNFCFYNPQYDDLSGAPNWAKASLDEHRDDKREHVYSFEQFELAKTHDELWNAAQRQLTQTGKIHGYMRMYWAKKVLEWSKSPEHAIDFLIRLNDFYSIDGGDPNGYVGILWSVAGLHDRPWFDRPVYGKVRYINQTGAKKRFAIEAYVRSSS